MACGGGGGRSASASSLPYVGSGSVGVSSQSSTGVITSCGVGVIVFPVRCGRLDRSSHSSWCVVAPFTASSSTYVVVPFAEMAARTGAVGIGGTHAPKMRRPMRCSMVYCYKGHRRAH